MKKAFIAIGVVLVIVGIIIVAVMGGGNIINAFSRSQLGDHDLNAASVQYEKEIEADRLSAVNVKTSIYAVYFVAAKEGGVKVKYMDTLPKDDAPIEVTYDETTRTLTVNQEQNVTDDIFAINRFLQNPDRFIVVELPQTLLTDNLQIDANVKYGGISAQDLICRSAKLQVKTGGVLLKNCKSENVNVVSNTGGVGVSDSRIDDFSVTTATGAVKARKTECKLLTVKVNTGAVSLENVTSEKVSAATNTGSINCDVRCDELTITSDTGAINFYTSASIIRLDSDTGAINGTVAGLKDDYDIRVKTDTGSCNLSNQTVGKGKLLNVNVDTGSINVVFEP